MEWACSGLGVNSAVMHYLKLFFLKTQLHLKGEVNSGDQCPEDSSYGVNEVVFLSGVNRINVTNNSYNSICRLIQ